MNLCTARHLQDAEALGEQLTLHQDELHRGLAVAQQRHEALRAQLADQARLSEQRTTELAEQIQAEHQHIETVKGDISHCLDDLAVRLREQQQ